MTTRGSHRHDEVAEPAARLLSSGPSHRVLRTALRLVALCAAVLSTTALADETQVLPRGVFLMDVQYSHSRLDKEWNNDRQARPLIADIVRYEPGGGVQGIISAHPVVQFDWLIPQLFYGLTDTLTVGVVVPVVMKTTIDTNLSWTPGDYQSQLGRPYSQEDFWQWAESMGQPRPADRWEGNRWTLADIVLATRWQLPKWELLENHGITAAATFSVALPTGKNADPEQLVAAGTNGWDVHSFGDAEVHLAAKKSLWVDGNGLERLAVGADVFYAFLRPRTFQTPHGTKNPLLLAYQPYVGDTYTIDGGDWLAGTLVLDAALFAGPTRASRVSGGSLEKAETLPAMISASLSYSYIATAQTYWHSDSALWDYEREKHWGPGDKNVFRANLTLSLLRVGVPLQFYGAWRSQEIIPGRNTRPSSVIGAGVRMLGKFW
ncbi:MAG: hypothetical protein ACJ790_06305 [Myxococcaceae bacterium]